MVSRMASRKIALTLATFVALTLSLFVSVPVDAQVAGATLQSTVTDASGAVVPNANVSIKNTATGITRVVTTGSAGLYRVPNLVVGFYDVSVSAAGFSTQVQSGVELTVGAVQVLNFSLQVGQVTENVQVPAEAPTVQLATSAISAEVTSTTVRELPLNGRDWTSLAVLQPGVIGIRSQISTGGLRNRGSRGFGNQLSNSGHRSTENSYRINGINVNDYSNGAPGSVLGAQLGVDAIQEFSVLTANYTAEYGRTSGGVINAVMKSGTNQFFPLRAQGLPKSGTTDEAAGRRNASLQRFSGCFAVKISKHFSRELGVTAATLSGWRDQFLEGGAANLKAREADVDNEETQRLKSLVADRYCRPRPRYPARLG